MSTQWPAMKAKTLLRLLKRAPLSYKEVPGGTRGSHRKLVSDAGYPPLRFSFHDSVEVGGTMIKKILLDQVGVDEATAMAILKG